MPESTTPCVLESSVTRAYRRKRALMLGKLPVGHTVDSVCGNSLCVAEEHVTARPWKSFKGNTGVWTRYAVKVAALQIDESVEFADFPHDKVPELRSGLAMCSAMSHIRFIVRSLPSGGIRIIRTGTYASHVSNLQDEFSDKIYPVLKISQSAPCFSLRPGAFFLGFLPGESMHRREVPQYKHCVAKGCAYPANGNSENLCNHHFHFFDYKSSLLGRYIDMADIYGTKHEAPRFYVNWYWKHERESLKFEHKGSTSWWQDRINFFIDKVGEGMEVRAQLNCSRKKRYSSKEAADAVISKGGFAPRRDAERVHSYLCPDCAQWHIGNEYTAYSKLAGARVRQSLSVPGLHHGISGLHRGKKPHSIARGVKASQKAKWKAAVQNRVGSKRTIQKPEKRWSRETLEKQADRILAASGFFAELRSSAENTCPRKIKYPTREAARKALQALRKRGKAGKTLEVYQCPHCSQFHLGNHWSPGQQFDEHYDTSESKYTLVLPDLTEDEERQILSEQLAEEYEWENVFTS